MRVLLLAGLALALAAGEAEPLLTEAAFGAAARDPGGVAIDRQNLFAQTRCAIEHGGERFGMAEGIIVRLCRIARQAQHVENVEHQ